MNRRELITTVTALAGAAITPGVLPAAQAAAQEATKSGPGEQITHVDSKTDGPLLQSRVVKAESLAAQGAAPGAKAYVHFNGPTEQLVSLSSGLVTLEPGAQPHPPHQHPEEEIMIVGAGSGEFFLNGAATQVKTGDMVFAESNVLHGVKNTGQTQMTFYFMKFMGKRAG